MRAALTPRGIAGAAALAVAMAAAAGDSLSPAEYYPPVLYVASLVMLVGMRDRNVLWGFAAVVLGLTVAGGVWSPAADQPLRPPAVWVNRAIVGAVILAVAGVLHHRLLLWDELDRRRREAEDASVRKSRFMAAIAHDIRSPAHAASLTTHLIRQTDDPARFATLVARLEASTTSLVDLLTDVLDLAAFDAGHIALAEAPFDVDEAIRRCCRPLFAFAEQKGVRLDLDGVASRRVLHGDRVKLARILQNVVENALKFTDAGSVRVAAEATADGGVRICVTDTGRGIPAADMCRVFDEFFQGDGGAARRPGRGLGLATAKRLVDAMGGRLDVRSVPGRGSSFTVTLPPAQRSGGPAPPRPANGATASP
jgi:signal transduction histidine kinase